MRNIILVSLLVVSAYVEAAALEKHHTYKLVAPILAEMVTVPGEETPPPIILKTHTKFQVHSISEDGALIKITAAIGGQEVPLDRFFYIKTEGADDYFREVWKIKSGVLAVPFKYRTDDGKLSGGATVGGYVGAATDWFKGEGGVIFGIGLTQVDLFDVNSGVEETKTGISLATGITFTQIGKGAELALIVGADHIGDSSWKYEDDPWVSLSINAPF